MDSTEAVADADVSVLVAQKFAGIWVKRKIHSLANVEVTRQGPSQGMFEVMYQDRVSAAARYSFPDGPFQKCQCFQPHFART